MCMLNEEMLEIILKKVLEELSRKGIDISSRKNQEEKPIKVSFLGKDNLLKDELKTYAKINDNIDFKTFFESLEKADSEKLVVSDLSIDELVDLSQGRKNIVTEFLLNSKEVFLVEEGLEYKRYQKPEALIKVYDGYLQNLKEFGVKVLKRVEISKMFTKREEFLFDKNSCMELVLFAAVCLELFFMFALFELDFESVTQPSTYLFRI